MLIMVARAKELGEADTLGVTTTWRTHLRTTGHVLRGFSDFAPTMLRSCDHLVSITSRYEMNLIGNDSIAVEQIHDTPTAGWTTIHAAPTGSSAIVGLDLHYRFRLDTSGDSRRLLDSLL